MSQRPEHQTLSLAFAGVVSWLCLGFYLGLSHLFGANWIENMSKNPKDLGERQRLVKVFCLQKVRGKSLGY